MAFDVVYHEEVTPEIEEVWRHGRFLMKQLRSFLCERGFQGRIEDNHSYLHSVSSDVPRGAFRALFYSVNHISDSTVNSTTIFVDEL
uniref:Gamma-tubulin complex component n=1 Tax=Ascaris lumbricoides TaxID=6252 RepID=A0A0M3I1B7_ASCLU